MKVFAPYLPVLDGNLAIWASTYKEKLGQLGGSLGLTEPEIAEQQTSAQAVIDSINRADLRKAELKEAIAAKEEVRQRQLVSIRNMVVHIKRSPLYTVSMGKELNIISSGQLVDASNLKPVINAIAFPGYVSISVRKQRSFGISIYTRLKGQKEWQHLGLAKSGPVLDDNPLMETDVPEMREYMARCYDGLEEVGHASNIAVAVFGG